MKIKLLSLILALTMLASIFVINTGAADEFVLKAEFEYSEDGEFLVVSGTTPAKYGQAINIVVYDPAFINGLEDIREESGELSENPAEKKPLSDISNLIRWNEVKADTNGEYNIRFVLDGIENGQYLIIKASGSGKMPVSASVLRQYYTDATINDVTLPAFENAQADELEQLLKQNQLLLAIELGEDYRKNKDKIHEMFVSVRNNDSKVSTETGRKFNSMEDVKNVLDIVDALLTFPENADGENVELYISRYYNLIEYDFSDENEHYTLVKNASYPIAATILNEDAPECMTDIKTAIAQSVALAMLNTKNADTVGPVVEKYASILGLDKTDYAIYCSKYTDYQVNKAFVDKNFTKPDEVILALKARVAVLAQENSSDTSGGSSGGSSGSSGSSGGFGSGGGFNGNKNNNSNMNNVIGVNDQLITSDKEKDEQNGTFYKDMTNTHWAYEDVQTLSSKNIIAGYPDGNFFPDAVVTREQLVKMLMTAFELEGNTELAFNDVENDRWSYDYIKSAVSLGIVNGMGDGTFLPAAGVTRQDAAVMIARICEKKGIALSGVSAVKDSAEIASYALESVERLVNAGIISGFEDGTFRPTRMLTRAQAAKLICGLLEK